MSALLLLTLQDAAAFVAKTARPSPGTTAETALFARDPHSMRVAEIKAELKSLRVGCGDCFDKESLVTRLNFARSNPPPPPTSPPAQQQQQQQQQKQQRRPVEPRAQQPPPPRRPAAQQQKSKPWDEPKAQRRPPPRKPWDEPSPGVEWGAESPEGSDIDMDVFAQAGWTGEENRKGLGDVDHDRSPGLSRNFDNMSTDDFKQSYRG